MFRKNNIDSPRLNEEHLNNADLSCINSKIDDLKSKGYIDALYLEALNQYKEKVARVLDKQPNYVKNDPRLSEAIHQWLEQISETLPVEESYQKHIFDFAATRSYGGKSAINDDNYDQRWDSSQAA